MNDAQQQFLDWGFSNYPEVFEAAMNATNAEASDYTQDSGFGGFFDSLGVVATNLSSGVGNFFSNFGTNLATAGNLYLQYRNDRDRIAINQQRARAGCPPIVDWNAAPPPCTNLSYNQYGQPVIGSGGISGWAVAGIGLGALALILFVSKQSR